MIKPNNEFSVKILFTDGRLLEIFHYNMGSALKEQKKASLLPNVLTAETKKHNA